VKLPEKVKRELLFNMIRIRRLEERIHELYLNNELIGMSPHLYVGQEAVAAGTIMNLKKDDYIISTHRGHGHTLAKGASAKSMIAELMGKETGCCKGRGGSMHIADVATGNLGANGIVGAGLPISVGAGISINYRGTNQVVTCFFGDGASNQGTFHESLNFSKVYHLPIIWICENNVYALSTPVKKTCATINISDRAKGYAMEGITIDGNDPETVYVTALQAIEKTRKEKEPVLIECKTYRHYGHGASDHRPYRTREEEKQWKKKDPIPVYSQKLKYEKVVSDEDIKKMQNDAFQEIEEAVLYARQSPEPPVEDVLKYIYA